MGEKILKIRAHHGMCLAFWGGRGYDLQFTKNMEEIKNKLEENPQVRLVAETDSICGPCPRNESGSCTDSSKVLGYDESVLRRCGLKEGEIARWKEFEQLVEEKILRAGRREPVCGDCRWNRLCREIEKEKFDRDQRL